MRLILNLIGRDMKFIIWYLFSSDSIEGVYHQVEESEYCKLNLFDSLIEMEKQKEQVIGNNYVYETEINKKGLYWPRWFCRRVGREIRRWQLRWRLWWRVWLLGKWTGLIQKSKQSILCFINVYFNSTLENWNTSELIVE